MMKMKYLASGALTTLFSILIMGLSMPHPAKAACTEPQTQTEMNICARQAYETADQNLNDIYANGISALNRQEKEALKNAQRAWITYRDLACQAYSLKAAGGTMQPLLFNDCLTRLTNERAQMLKEQFEEG